MKNEMMTFQGSQDYVVSPQLMNAVNIAIALKKPLLIKGEPGTGKTMLAEAVSKALGKDLIIWNIKSTTKAQDGLYVYDVVQRLYDSQFGNEGVDDIKKYVKLGKLGEAFSADQQVILLIDEILAVGDVNFQTKCFNKLVDIKKQGTTIVLVSHSAEQIERICERSIWIQDGKIMMDGAPRDVNRAYMIHMGELREEMLQATVEQEEETDPESAGCPNDRQAEEAPNAGHHRGSGEAFLQEVYTTDSSGKRKSVFQTGEAVVFHLSYLQKQAVPESYFGLSIFRNDGIRCYGTNTEVDGIREYILEGDGEMCVTFPSLQLLSGSYYVDVCIAKTNWEMIDYYDTTCSFEVFHTDQDIGMVRLSHSWQLNPAADGRNTPACPSGKDERDDH